ncbi:MAG: CoB--CoM heterodisulfide reductase iron-sulfur subunit A family protein [Candidatus Eisenbacteria bacterium]
MDQDKKTQETGGIRLGVYVCHCGINIARTVDVARVAEMASKLPGVIVAKTYEYMCSDPGQNLIKSDIEEHGLTGVVVAACSPRMHEPTFRAAVAEAGMNPYLFEMANIREQCSWIHEDRDDATAKAADLVRAAVARASRLATLTEREIEVIPEALVIGAGIAGIQSALDIAEAGYKVHLVEREPSIGGRMAQLDKTFPTLDCSACILTPKMVDVARHPNIDLLAYSEIEEITGYVGNFHVKVRKKATSVDRHLCTSCGDCIEKCPSRVPSEFNEGAGTRKSIYRPFPQAVPSEPVLDRETCLYFTSDGKCGVCAKICTLNAIDYSLEDEFVEFDVGTIVVATGYDEFDPNLKPELGYGVYDNVITGLEMERLCSASGPTEGAIRVGDKEPKDVVFIQCVGSRDETVGNEYCSRVCCMFTAKQAHLIREKLPNAAITIFYMDIRAFGKGFEEFYDRVRKENVVYRRGSVSEIYKRGERLVARGEDTLLGEPMEVEADLVVLAAGLVPRGETADIVKLLKLSRSSDGFLMEAHPKLRPVDTSVDGVFLAGCCQGPKDIPDAVAQAKGAASSAIAPMARGTVMAEALTAVIDEDLCSGCRICVSVCPYGALAYDEDDDVSKVNEALCKGCGTCAAACPSGSITMSHFTSDQLLAQVVALIGGTDG